MPRKCIEGHAIEDGKDVCEDGHQPPAEGATATPIISISTQQLQDIIQGAIKGALEAQASIHTSLPPASNTKKPDRTGINLNSNESQCIFSSTNGRNTRPRLDLQVTLR